MRFASVRSGLAESFDDVTAVAIDGSGKTLYQSGDINAPFFYRSSIKPIQALAAHRAGLELPPEHLAVTCSSHAGYPVHIAIVRRILADAGLSETDLLTARGRPRSKIADGWLRRHDSSTHPSQLLGKARRVAGSVSCQRLGHRPLHGSRSPDAAVGPGCRPRDNRRGS